MKMKQFLRSIKRVGMLLAMSSRTEIEMWFGRSVNKGMFEGFGMDFWGTGRWTGEGPDGIDACSSVYQMK
jgi:hypothetical protein